MHIHTRTHTYIHTCNQGVAASSSFERGMPANTSIHTSSPAYTSIHTFAATEPSIPMPIRSPTRAKTHAPLPPSDAAPAPPSVTLASVEGLRATPLRALPMRALPMRALPIGGAAIGEEPTVSVDT